eukprot:TRINITY_DN5599_c0_g1_i2.p1 TRINITY_DN5599_c0_g1~~TRINITY_DN5599_c0_g1_i2.p1  ORF type:complete len:1035 (+),score=133.88 TRINITY_DN5599_c0_g1_i2:174-3278(+)
MASRWSFAASTARFPRNRLSNSPHTLLNAHARSWWPTRRLGRNVVNIRSRYSDAGRLDTVEVTNSLGNNKPMATMAPTTATPKVATSSNSTGSTIVTNHAPCTRSFSSNRLTMHAPTRRRAQQERSTQQLRQHEHVDRQQPQLSRLPPRPKYVSCTKWSSVRESQRCRYATKSGIAHSPSTSSSPSPSSSPSSPMDHDVADVETTKPGMVSLNHLSWDQERDSGTVLVEYVQRDTRTLAIVESPVTNKLWQVTTATGQPLHLSIHQITFQFPTLHDGGTKPNATSAAELPHVPPPAVLSSSLKYLQKDIRPVLASSKIALEWACNHTTGGQPAAGHSDDTANTGQSKNDMDQLAERVWKESLSSDHEQHTFTAYDILPVLFPKEHYGRSVTATELYSAHCLLFLHKGYFKPLGGGVFASRSPGDVQVLRRRVAELKSLHNDLQLAKEVLAARLQRNSTDNNTSHLPPMPPSIHNELRDIASAKVSINAHSPIYTELLAPSGYGHRAKDVYNLLCTAGFWSSQFSPTLMRCSLLGFEEHEEKIAENLIEHPPEDIVKHRRWQLKSMPVYTIDDRDAFEVDDGISITPVDQSGNHWVYVHIADPTRYILPGSTLDHAARIRANTLYLPERTVPMLPKALVARCSLRTGRENMAVTVAAKVAPDGSILEYEVGPSVIQNIYPITYANADKAIHTNRNTSPSSYQSVGTELTALWDTAKRRLAFRKACGAVPVSLPQPRITANDRGIQLSSFESGTGDSRLMVAEYMILAGSIMADYACKKQVSIPFRVSVAHSERSRSSSASSQTSSSSSSSSSSPSMNDTTPSMPNNKFNNSAGGSGDVEDEVERLRLVENWNLVSASHEARTMVVKAPHYGLGLAGYCKATSPLRKYIDLLVHHQVKAIFASEDSAVGASGDDGDERESVRVPFSKVTMAKLIQSVESVAMERSSMGNAVDRFWLLRYLEDNERAAQNIQSLVLSNRGGEGIVLLQEYGLRVRVRLMPEHTPGRTVTLRVAQVDAFEGHLDLVLTGRMGYTQVRQ